MTGKEIDGYVVLTTRDGGAEFRIADAVLRSISVEVMRGFGITRRRGAEVGGVLVGSIRKGLLTVDECEIVTCEYAYGPSYLLSDKDAARFDEAVQRGRAAGGDKQAVGLFRSHTRDGLQPDAPDLELFSKYFSGTPASLLLIKPYATRSPDAALFLTVNGKLPSEPAIEFPFAALSPPSGPEPVKPVRFATELPTSAAAASEPEPPPPVQHESERLVVLPRIPTERERLLQEVLGPPEAPQPTPRVAPDRELFGEYTKPQATSVWQVVWWTLFIVSAVAFGFAAGYRQAGGNLASAMPWAEPAPPKDVYSLGLTARLRGDAILIQWDRYSDVMKNAQRAVVIVTTSSGRQEIPLEANELKAGILLYRTEAAEADVRLEVFVAPERLVAQQTVWKRGARVEQ